MTSNDIDTMTRAELKNRLSELGITDKSGSKNMFKKKIKNKVEEDAIAELRNNLELTGHVLYPEANEAKQIDKYYSNGVYVYIHHEDNIPGRLTAAKLGYTPFEAERRSLKSLVRDRDSFLTKNFNSSYSPTYPE